MKSDLLKIFAASSLAFVGTANGATVSRIDVNGNCDYGWLAADIGVIRADHVE